MRLSTPLCPCQHWTTKLQLEVKEIQLQPNDMGDAGHSQLHLLSFSDDDLPPECVQSVAKVHEGRYVARRRMAKPITNHDDETGVEACAIDVWLYGRVVGVDVANFDRGCYNI